MIPMMTSAATSRRPTGFEQLGQVESNFSMTDLNDNDVADSTDLQRFVQSLSKILGATKFGLTFEFQNLKFHPPKAPRPILQDVSGCINAGSLWGVMGASGAGKCKGPIDYPRGALANIL
jgi:ABC-type multidrug transport system fused ATPase/permease subunit